MCKHMVDGNEQKGHGKTTAVSEDAEAEIFITFKWKQYIMAMLSSHFPQATLSTSSNSSEMPWQNLRP